MSLKNYLVFSLLAPCCFYTHDKAIANNTQVFSPSVQAKEINAPKELIELSLEMAVLFAFNENPDIQMAQSREDQAHYAISEGKAALYPKITLTNSLSHQYNVPNSALPSNQSYSVGFLARQLIFDGDTTRKLVNKRQQIHQSSILMTRIEQEKILLEVLENYLQILRLQKTVEENSRLVNEISIVTNKLILSEEAGGASKAKVNYAKARLAFSKGQLTDTITALNDTVNTLESFTGPLPKHVVVYPRNIRLDQYKLNDYINFAKKFNNEIVLNNSDKQALEYQLQSEKGKFFPKINFELKAEQSHDDGGADLGRKREVEALIETRYVLFDGWGRKSTVSRVSNQVKELEIKDRKIKKDIIRDIKQAYNQLSAVKSSIASTDDEIKANLSLQALNKQNFELGSIDIIELIEGEERLNIAYSKRHELVSDYFLNMYGLLLRAGLLDKNFFCESC